MAEWAFHSEGLAEAKAGRGHLQQDFLKNGFKTFVIEQKEAISKSMSVFAYFTNNPLSSHTSWKFSKSICV